MKSLFLALLVLLLRLPVQAAPPAMDWQTRGVGGGGALFSPSFSPHDPNEFWISCDMSELFQTKSLGTSWRMVPFRRLQGNRESFVRFTSDPTIIFALDFTGDAGRPSRSSDGGKTWVPLTTDPTGHDAYSLWADPVSTQRLLVAAYDRIFFSSNGGTAWNTVYTNADQNAGVRIAGVFWDGTDIAIGTNVGVLASTNNGASFSVLAATGIPAGQDIVSFTGARTGGLRRLACATAPMAVSYWNVVEDFFDVLGGSAPTIYTLDWGTSTAWQLRNAGLPATYQLPWVGMARNDASVIWVAGANGGEVPVVYRSTNAGANWSSVLNTTNNGNVATGWAGQGGDRGWTYGGNPVGFSVAPTDSTKAAFTDYGFCHLTTNSGTSWRQAYLNPADQNPAGVNTPTGRSYHSVGMENTTCWQVFFPTATRLLLGHSDIKASKSDDRGYSWNFNYTGHSDNSMYRVVAHTDPSLHTLYAATSAVHDLYQSTYLQDGRIETGGGKVIVSTTNGASWTTLKTFAQPVIWVATDPTNPNRLYASVIHWNNGSSPQGGIYRTDHLDQGTSAVWVKCGSPPRTEGHPYNIVVLNDGAVVATYSGRRGSSGFTASSGVYYSIDQGTTWLDRSHANMQYWTKDVVVDPYDATQNTWYACVFNGWGGPPNDKGGLYRTTNRGQAWTQIFSNANVPTTLANVESVTVHPTIPGTAYLTTEQDGLWYTSNLGAPTPNWEAVTGYPFRQPTRVFFDPTDVTKLWVTSFGHGLCVGMAPLAAWKEEHFGPQSTDPSIAGDAADPDRDGTNNLVEFSQHTDPLLGDARPLPPGGTAGLPVLSGTGGWHFDFLRRGAATSPGVTYAAEYSVDMVNWQPLTGTPQVTSVDETWERVSWPLGAGMPHIFLRLSVARP